MELAEWQYRKYCTSDAKKALVEITGDFVFLFCMIFWYFSQHKKQQNRSYTKFHLKQSSDVVYRKSGSSLKSVRELWRIFFFIFLIFLTILSKPNRPKDSLAGLRMVSTSSCKNFRFFGHPSEKLCPVYGRFLKLCFKNDRDETNVSFLLRFFCFCFFYVTEGEK